MAEEAQATPAENAQSNPHCEQESCARPGLPGCAWENGPCRVLLEQGHTRNMVPSLLTPCDGQASLQAEVLCVAVSSANVLDSGRARLPWVHPGLLSFLPPSLPALPYSPQSLPSTHAQAHAHTPAFTPACSTRISSAPQHSVAFNSQGTGSGLPWQPEQLFISHETKDSGEGRRWEPEDRFLSPARSL